MWSHQVDDPNNGDNIDANHTDANDSNGNNASDSNGADKGPPPPLVRATAGRAARTSGRAWTSRGSEGLVDYEIIDYIINAPSRGSEEDTSRCYPDT